MFCSFCAAVPLYNFLSSLLNSLGLTSMHSEAYGMSSTLGASEASAFDLADLGHHGEFFTGLFLKGRLFSCLSGATIFLG
ncbi:hypothetical protein EJ04DRAFT_310183 [Polyplosphaeria fusca]|uniref:Uncharacterized protein n=1 Tax=Polyplosphaeria fusca TaxID=682080 RepID=A0A9P4V8D4_9PLEO|nr:hypothetical protein EJ04DRAFT_310183 [Polyplosphaeria fusca]